MNSMTQMLDLEKKAELDQALLSLENAKQAWAQTSPKQRIAVLEAIKDELLKVSEAWVNAAARSKQLPLDSPLLGEEWTSGPYAFMACCNGLIDTLSKVDGQRYLDHLKTRETTTGQLAVQILPQSIWEHLLMSGVKAEVWMQSQVNATNLKRHAGWCYSKPQAERKGKVALVLGAGNITAISPLDCFQKLFLEDQVCLLKMNPFTDYLAPILRRAMAPLMDMDALRIVTAGPEDGPYLTNHELVEELHITGSHLTHDAIIWGVGEQGEENKRNNTPINTRPMTSELGGVCPTIVVPGPWSQADINFQAEHIATQKLHNSGFNCVACQALVLPNSWNQKDALLQAVKGVMGQSTRPAYYPGAGNRLDAFASHAGQTQQVSRGDVAPACIINSLNQDGDSWYRDNEVFGPALSTMELDNSAGAEAYLKAAIDYCNKELRGTLGANILIHPKTIKQIGKKKFESLVAELKYGTIAINGWSGLGFLVTQCPWGAYPGHTLDDVQSGIGFVHNTFLLEDIERTIVYAPWRPFPRGLASGQLSLLPRPPWFITNKKQDKVGKLLTHFQHKPGWLKLPRLFVNALLG